MRKCRGCGYLSLGDGDQCGRCGGDLVAAAAGTPVGVAVGASGGSAASAAGSAPSSPPPGSISSTSPPAPDPFRSNVAIAPPSASVPPSAAGGSSAWAPGRESWSPEPAWSQPDKKSRSTFSRAVSLFLALVLAYAAFTFARGFFGDKPPASLNGWMDGEGQTYQGTGYSVRFPETPTPMLSSTVVLKSSIPISGASVFRDDYELAVGAGSLPGNVQITPEFIEQNEGAFADAFKQGVGAEGLTTERSTLDGHPAIDMSMKIEHGEKISMRVAQIDRKFVVVFAHTRKGVDQVLDEFAESFHAGTAIPTL